MRISPENRKNSFLFLYPVAELLGPAASIIANQNSSVPLVAWEREMKLNNLIGFFPPLLLVTLIDIHQEAEVFQPYLILDSNPLS